MVKILNYKIQVFGRVQGVGYRDFASRMANGLELVGYVKNMTDGSVLIEAEGDKLILDKFLILCENGPGWANVEKTKVAESPIMGYKDFKVRY